MSIYLAIFVLPVDIRGECAASEPVCGSTRTIYDIGLVMTCSSTKNLETLVSLLLGQ